MKEQFKFDIFAPVTDWKDLQNKVGLLFNQIGLEAEIEKKIETPRGEVEVDVFAIDPNSVDKISSPCVIPMCAFRLRLLRAQSMMWHC